MAHWLYGYNSIIKLYVKTFSSTPVLCYNSTLEIITPRGKKNPKKANNIMVIKVDHNKCIGCGRCTEVCPDTFRLNAEGKSEVIGENKECALSAADQCPVEAIYVEE